MAVQVARHLHTPIGQIEAMRIPDFIAYHEALVRALKLEAPKQ